MSTAILHAGSFIHEYDIVMKNQNSSVKLNNVVINSSNYKEQIQRSNKEEMHFMKQRNDAYMTKYIAAQKQRIPAEPNQHNTLARTVSTPMPIPDANQVVNNLFSSLNDILNVGATVTGSGHRKLERTQSEPLPQTNTSRYKTELCRPFEEAGECKYGDKCQFAHGINELRNLQRHPKYKTELCRTFHSVGFCPYGARCHFVHSSQEALTHNRQVAAYHARLQQQQQQSRMKTMSMSTGSDRETSSSVGSISPTMTHVQNQSGFFVDQQSPTGVFTFTFSQSSSPIQDMAPISPPPPAQFAKPQPYNDHHANVMRQMSIPEETRLPVFNQISACQISSATDSMNNLTI